MTVLIRGAKVIDESSPHHLQTVDIFIDKGTVQKIDEHLDMQADTVVSANDLHISSGWVDIFADYCEPGYEHKETIASGLASAASGGFTNVFITPNTNPTISSKSIVQYLKQQAEGNVVSLFPIGAVSNNMEGKKLAEMLDMKANGAIAFSDAWKSIQNANLMLKALEYVKAFEGTLISIPIDSTLTEGGLMHEGIESTKLGMPGIPTLAETLILHRDIELLRYTGSKLHVTGISSAESLAMIRKAKADGLNISCSVSPYHLAFNDEILRSYNAMYKVMPPIRLEADRLVLIEGLGDGTIDCIASHHRPQDWDAKSKEFEYAADGMNVQQLSFAISNDVVNAFLPIEKLIKLFSKNARAIFGLNKMPIAIDTKADFTLFSPSLKTEISKLKSKSANNPFINKSLNGKVIGIVKDAKIILND